MVHHRRGNNRVQRGGSYFNHSENCRSAYRNNNWPENRNNNIGFRLALSPQLTGSTCPANGCWRQVATEQVVVLFVEGWKLGNWKLRPELNFNEFLDNQFTRDEKVAGNGHSGGGIGSHRAKILPPILNKNIDRYET